MINFKEYDDEKLRLWILAWEYFSQVRALHDKEVYQEAKQEMFRRMEEVLKKEG